MNAPPQQAEIATDDWATNPLAGQSIVENTKVSITLHSMVRRGTTEGINDQVSITTNAVNPVRAKRKLASHRHWSRNSPSRVILRLPLLRHCIHSRQHPSLHSVFDRQPRSIFCQSLETAVCRRHLRRSVVIPSHVDSLLRACRCLID